LRTWDRERKGRRKKYLEMNKILEYHKKRKRKDGINIKIFIVKYFFETCITTTQGES
jgi:hypothetical protein